MMQRGGGHTVPQIFIGGEPIGGCEELFELDFDGALDARLGIADDG
jgi:glutaredoxin 3